MTFAAVLATVLFFSLWSDYCSRAFSDFTVVSLRLQALFLSNLLRRSDLDVKNDAFVNYVFDF